MTQPRPERGTVKTLFLSICTRSSENRADLFKPVFHTIDINYNFIILRGNCM